MQQIALSQISKELLIIVLNLAQFSHILFLFFCSRAAGDKMTPHPMSSCVHEIRVQEQLFQYYWHDGH